MKTLADKVRSKKGMGRQPAKSAPDSPPAQVQAAGDYLPTVEAVVKSKGKKRSGKPIWMQEGK